MPSRPKERDQDCTDVATVTRDEDSHLLPPDVAEERCGEFVSVNLIRHGSVVIRRA